MIFSPSSFVLSNEGKQAQKKIWSETMELLRKEAPRASFPTFPNTTGKMDSGEGVQ